MEVTLSLVDVLIIHELLLEQFGGMRGITEQGFGKLEAALAAPRLSMFGEDLYPDFGSKAAVLFSGLARAHSLTDGNKRVALVGLIEVLHRHGKVLRASDDELYSFVMAAADDLTREAVIDWIAQRIEPENQR